MADINEQQIYIKFWFKLGKNAADAYRMLQKAFRHQATNQARTFEWFKCFKEDGTSVGDDEESVTTPKMIERLGEHANQESKYCKYLRQHCSTTRF